jgi:hypothetical protein
MAGTSNIRYLYPILQYSTDNEGNVISKKVDLKILCAGDDLNKSIITLSKGYVQNLGGIDHVDLLVTCNDDKYQKLTLSPIGGASWRNVPAIVQMVTERWNEDGKNAYLAVARIIDEPQFLKLVGLENTPGSGVVNSAGFGFANASNQDISKFFND